MKKLILFLLILLILPLISSVNITDITLLGGEEGSIFINDSITITGLKLDSSSVNVYYLTSPGIFTNLNTSSIATLILYGLIYPNNDIKWDDETILVRDVNYNITILINPLRYIFVGNFPATTSGGQSYSFTKLLSSEICEYTYQHLLEYGETNNEKLKLDLDEMNLIIDESKLNSEYITSFQGGCSEVILKTLKPEFVCLSIENYVKNTNKTIGSEDINLLRKEISLIIPITKNLLKYYINDFNNVCSEFYTKPLILRVNESKGVFLLIFIILFLGLIILSTGNRYKKIIKKLKSF